MAAGWLVVVLVLLLPGAAAGQIRVTPDPRIIDPNPEVITRPRNPPAPTIPSLPVVRVPFPSAGVDREVRTFQIRPTVSLIEEYSDNFNRSSSGSATSNLRSSLSPGVNVLLDRGVLVAIGVYRFLASHDSSTDDIRYDHTLNGRLVWEPTSRLRLTVGTTFTQSDEPEQADRLDLNVGRREFTRNFFSVDVDYALGLIDTRWYYRLSLFDATDQTTTSHTMGASATQPIGQIHAITLGYEYLTSETTVDVVNAASLVQSDSKVTGHQITATFSRDLRIDMTAGLTGQVAYREQTTGSVTSDFTRWNVSFFSNYFLPQTIVLRSSLGVGQISSSSQGRASDLQFQSNTNLSYFFGPAVVNVTLERGFAETFAEGENFGVVETSGYLISLGYTFSPLLRGLVRAGYRENKFLGGGGASTAQKNETFSAGAQLTYQVLQWLTASFDYGYSKSQSEPDFSSSENRVRLSLNASF
jgi:hypothetical protein